MKELESKKAELLRQPAAEDKQPAKVKQRHKSQPPVPAEPGGLFNRETLSHPANAESLAGLLGQLQHSHGNRYVQRLVSGLTPAPADAGLQPAGQPLDTADRTQMEAAFGEDFAAVRVHADSQAQDATEQLGARAFTHGQDIYFGQGEYAPATPAGKGILAHELTHVVQQQRGSAGQQAAALTHTAADTLEEEADRAAAAVLAGQRPSVVSHSAAPGLQRKEKEAEKPSLQHHSREIGPSPPSGTINAGRFSVAYAYNVVAGADFVPLILQVPAGVTAGVIPLTEVGSGDYRVNDPGGAGARAVTITVSYHLKSLSKIQVTLTQGSFTYVVVFQFPQSGK